MLVGCSPASRASLAATLLAVLVTPRSADQLVPLTVRRKLMSSGAWIAYSATRISAAEKVDASAPPLGSSARVATGVAG